MVLGLVTDKSPLFTSDASSLLPLSAMIPNQTSTLWLWDPFVRCVFCEYDSEVFVWLLSHLVFGFVMVCNGHEKQSMQDKRRAALIYLEITALCLQIQQQTTEGGGFSSRSNTHSVPRHCACQLQARDPRSCPPTCRNVCSAKLHLRDDAENCRQRQTTWDRYLTVQWWFSWAVLTKVSVFPNCISVPWFPW